MTKCKLSLSQWRGFRSIWGENWNETRMSQSFHTIHHLHSSYNFYCPIKNTRKKRDLQDGWETLQSGKAEGQKQSTWNSWANSSMQMTMMDLQTIINTFYHANSKLSLTIKAKKAQVVYQPAPQNPPAIKLLHWTMWIASLTWQVLLNADIYAASNKQLSLLSSWILRSKFTKLS